MCAAYCRKRGFVLGFLRQIRIAVSFPLPIQSCGDGFAFFVGNQVFRADGFKDAFHAVCGHGGVERDVERPCVDDAPEGGGDSWVLLHEDGDRLSTARSVSQQGAPDAFCSTQECFKRDAIVAVRERDLPGHARGCVFQIFQNIGLHIFTS